MKFAAYVETEKHGTKKFKFDSDNPTEAFKYASELWDMKNISLLTDGIYSYPLNFLETGKAQKLRVELCL